MDSETTVWIKKKVSAKERAREGQWPEMDSHAGTCSVVPGELLSWMHNSLLAIPPLSVKIANGFVKLAIVPGRIIMRYKSLIFMVYNCN